MKRYTITLKVSDPYDLHEGAQDLEVKVGDLLRKAVLPALNLELAPLTLEVKRAVKFPGE